MNTSSSASATADYTSLLERSNELYRTMVQLLDVFNASPETMFQTLRDDSLLQFKELHGTIEEHDSRLQLMLRAPHNQDPSISHLIAERRELLEEVLRRNRALTLQALAIQSLIGDEIRQSSTGHAALKGYRNLNEQASNGSFRNSM